MYATLMISWVRLPPELEKSSIASPVCSSLGKESFSLFYIIINDQFPSIMCGVFDVETEHGLFPPHRPHSEGSSLLPRPKGRGVPHQSHPSAALGFSPSPCPKLGRRCRWWWLCKKSPGLHFLGCLLHDVFFICCPVACCALVEL